MTKHQRNAQTLAYEHSKPVPNLAPKIGAILYLEIKHIVSSDEFKKKGTTIDSKQLFKSIMQNIYKKHQCSPSITKPLICFNL